MNDHGTTATERTVTLSKGIFTPRIFSTLVSLLLVSFAILVPRLPASSQSNGDPIVVMQTTKGPIALQIFVNAAPNTARNFLDLVQRGFYNGLTFHRIENWCIQGGDPNGNGSGNFVDPSTGQVRYLNLEINPRLSHNSPGVLAMARSTNPNSASCQFYITKAGMPQLNGQYAIFGHVVDGMQSVYSMGRGDRIMSAQIVEGGSSGSSSSSSSSASSTTPVRSHSSGPPKDSGF
jgi:cyclophilin family peptidyl-prolyl cis-trans isomerase